MFSIFKKLSDDPVELYYNIINGKDVKASFEKLLKQVEKGNIKSTYYLGLCYNFGYYVDKNVDLFLKYLSMAADANYYYAVSSLGNCYMSGEFFEKDYSKAVECYERSLQDKDAPVEEKAFVHYNLFMCYHNGGYGLERNLDLALSHLCTAAKNNDEALLQLALWYFHGYNIQQNLEKAFEFFRILADDKLSNEDNDNGNGQGVDFSAIYAEANYYLGLCFENGYGTSIQLDNAKYWYRKAAEYGVEAAIKRLEEWQ